MTVMARNLDLYGLLQVDPRAEPMVIQAAFHVLARREHPDQSHSESTAPAMAMLNRAYSVLRDPLQRRAYDQSRTASAAAAAPAVGSGGARPAAPPSVPGSATLNFGRYQGWSLKDLGRHDPEYLEWLRRHSSGVGYRQQIDIILEAKRAAAAPAPARRRR
jgi:DnaJ-class molecular chaperone